MQFFRLILSIMLFMFICGTEAFAQLPTFSGFWRTPQLTAPTAMAGNNAYQVTAHYRRQGFEESTGYRTFMLSGQMPLYTRTNTHFGTLGANLLRDETGSSYIFTTTGAMLTYLYDARLSSRHHLVGGVQGSYYWRKVDWSKVSTSNQYVNGHYDPAIGSGEEFSDDPGQAFLGNVGLAYYLTDSEGNQLFHLGAAYTNINNGSFTYLKNSKDQAVPQMLVGYAHVRLYSNSYFDVVSDLFWRSHQAVNDWVGGVRLRKGTGKRLSIADSHLGAGIYYSQDQSGIISLELVQPKWLFGISYDMVFGNDPLQKMQNAVEVSLGWRGLGRKDRGPNRRKLPWEGKNKLPWLD